VAKLIEYDVTDVEPGGGQGDEPQPAVYDGTIKTVEYRDQKSDGSPVNDIHLAIDIGGGHRWMHTYINLDGAADWKLRELTDALGLPPKGKIDPDKFKNKKLRVKVNPGTYDWGDGNGPVYRAQTGTLLKPKSSDDYEPETDGAPSDVTSEDAGFVAYREGQPDPENPTEEIGSYDDWTDDDLEAEVSDRNLTVPGGRGKKRDKYINALRSDDEETTATEPAQPAEDSFVATREGDENGSYDDWPEEDLTAELNDRGLPTPGGRGKKQDKIIAALRADDAEAGGGSEEGDDYESWTAEELMTQIDERGLKSKLPRGRKTKDQLIAVLREDDAADPFDPSA
jgi:hypothetical protein